MKALYFNGSTIEYHQDYPQPQPSSAESLVRILRCAICNTDKEIQRGYKPDFRGIMGHEFVGIVEKSHDSALIGKRVVGELNAGCGHCLYCQTGREKHCHQRKVLGMAQKDGCFAQWMTIATKLLHPVPDEIPTEQALFTEPLAAALEIPTQLHLDPTEKVAILGDGKLAFLIAQVMALVGVELTVIGKHEEKLKTLQPFAQTTTKGQEEGYETVIEATGTPLGFMTAQKLVRKQGRIVCKSTYAQQVQVDISSLVVNEITLVGSRCGPFAPALRLLQQKRTLLPSIQFYPLQAYEQAFSVTTHKAGFIL